MVQLISNLSSSVSCVLAKVQYHTMAKWSFSVLLLRVQKRAPKIQCVQHAGVNSYALSWQEWHTTDILLPIHVYGSVLNLLRGSLDSSQVPDLLGVHQLQCTKRAQGLTGELLVEFGNQLQFGTQLDALCSFDIQFLAIHSSGYGPSFLRIYLVKEENQKTPGISVVIPVAIPYGLGYAQWEIAWQRDGECFDIRVQFCCESSQVLGTCFCINLGSESYQWTYAQLHQWECSEIETYLNSWSSIRPKSAGQLQPKPPWLYILIKMDTEDEERGLHRHELHVTTRGMEAELHSFCQSTSRSLMQDPGIPSGNRKMELCMVARKLLILHPQDVLVTWKRYKIHWSCGRMPWDPGGSSWCDWFSPCDDQGQFQGGRPMPALGQHKELRLPWDTGGPATSGQLKRRNQQCIQLGSQQRRLGVKPSLKEGGMLGTYSTATELASWAVTWAKPDTVPSYIYLNGDNAHAILGITVNQAAAAGVCLL
jgi:hypothetical protein